MTHYRLPWFLLAAAATVALPAAAQLQVKPRILVVVDTSGSMQNDFAGNDTGGDGSTFYKDSLITRSASIDHNLTPYIGTEVSPNVNQCFPAGTPPDSEIYSGFDSRLFAVKAALTSVVKNSTGIDWALERYTGNTACTVFSHTFAKDVMAQPAGRCRFGSQCASGTCNGANQCTCASAGQCPAGFACTGGVCAVTNDGAGTNVCSNDGGWGRIGISCGCAADSQCPMGRCAGGLCVCASGANPNSDGSCTCSGSSDCNGGRLCSGSSCGSYADFSPQACTGNPDCGSGQTCLGGKCTCAHDDDCKNVDVGAPAAQVCGPDGFCGLDRNLCYFANERETSHRNNLTCGDHAVPMGISYAGTCGTSDSAPNTAPCNSRQVCYQNSDCGSNNCVKVATTDTWGECFCSSAPQCRNASDYTCSGSRCVYNRACQSVGGNILVDPAAPGYTPNQALLWTNGSEDATTNDPELRASGSTPLAGSARTAMAWYNAIKNYSLINATSANCLAGLDANPLCDAKILCRPYVLVQMTDGVDTCETNAGGNNAEGPVAAVAGFVDATPTGERFSNQVYEVGLGVDAATQSLLNATAKMGGTGQAILANDSAATEKALADIATAVTASMTEKCNYIDDDCNNVIDEPYPDLNGSCSNGAIGHCAAAGKFKCSTDQLGLSCGPLGCRNGSGSSLTKVDGTHARLNGVTGFVAGDVGASVSIVSSRIASNRGTFTITSVNATSVTYLNSGGGNESFPAGYEIGCLPPAICRGDAGAGPLTHVGNDSTLAGVSGMTTADVGDSITISGATDSSNNGTFVITAQTGTTVTFANAAGVEQAAGAITWAIDCRSPSCRRASGASLANQDGTTGRIDLVGGNGFASTDVGKVITVRNAANASNVGNFTIQARLSATSVRLDNPAGVNEAGTVEWNIYCANGESLMGCNNFDDDCNGVNDDCIEGLAGSCCSASYCPPSVANGTSCDDANPCTYDDRCNQGTCAGTAVACPAPSTCVPSYTCNGTASCTPNPAGDGTVCDDGDGCTTGDVCAASVCGGTPVTCAALDECHDVGTCASSGTCSNPPKSDGTVCSLGTCRAGSCSAPVDAGEVDAGEGDGAEAGADGGLALDGGTPADGPDATQDTGVPESDASPRPDSSVDAEGGVVAVDANRPSDANGATDSARDARMADAAEDGEQGDVAGDQGGCACRAARGHVTTNVALPLLGLGLALLRRRPRRPFSSRRTRDRKSQPAGALPVLNANCASKARL